jgi:hypothetical protein
MHGWDHTWPDQIVPDLHVEIIEGRLLELRFESGNRVQANGGAAGHKDGIGLGRQSRGFPPTSKAVIMPSSSDIAAESTPHWLRVVIPTTLNPPASII